MQTTDCTITQTLADHYKSLPVLKTLFANDPKRFDHFNVQAGDLHCDYSKNPVTLETIRLLASLLEKKHFAQKRDAMFAGEKINTTEDRPVLHTALRSNSTTPLMVTGENIREAIHSTKTKMREISDAIRSRKWKGFSGKPITDIVSIGIGGSDLGPRMVTEALSPYWHASLRCHFISNLDGESIARCLEGLNPETTLVLVSSKTFTTLETLSNADYVKAWLQKKTQDLSQHFIAITAAVDKAKAYGIAEKNILPFWDWVGGRYSLWSAIGLPIAIMIGMEGFEALLSGAATMDSHFQEAPLEKNMPVLLGLIGYWHIVYGGRNSLAILPYSESLKYFRAHIQQMDMESNGKSVMMNGEPVTSMTSPVIWGEVGCNGQHSFHQLLHQGTQGVAVDFILPMKNHYGTKAQQRNMVASCLSQSQALMQGKTGEQLKEEGCPEDLIPHKVIPGNRPSNTIYFEKLTPGVLGQLIALYEHKVFVQGVLWGVNSFDQWGVELGKQLGKQLAKALQGDEMEMDSSTRGLVDEYLTGILPHPF